MFTNTDNTFDFEDNDAVLDADKTVVKDEGEKTAILVSSFSKNEEGEAKISVEELERLFDTAGGKTLGVLTQVRDKPDGRTFIGKGKIEELSELIRATGAELVVFDTELSPMQIKIIEEELDSSVSVIDRSMLILDIFAKRASSAEGRLQVELAQLQYTAPRLMGKGKQMSRLGGGVGTRGPGESKLEIDRRRLKSRIRGLEEDLERLSSVRSTQRSARIRSGITCVSVVGYTNAGKSTLLNCLTDAGVLSEDKLFATLDPTTRQFTLPSGKKILLTDTVGFIRNLPHHLISAFKSTLDEAVLADVLLIVCDASDENLASQLDVTRQLLCDLGAAEKPMLFVFNKCDAVSDPARLNELKHIAVSADEKCVFISALTGDGIDEFSAALDSIIASGKRRIRLSVPISDGGVLSSVYKLCENVEVEYTNELINIVAVADAKSAGQLKRFIVGYDSVFGNGELA